MPKSAKPSVARVRSLMVVADGKGIPLGVSVHSASPHEVKLANKTIEKVGKKPKCLVCDKAYDSKKLRSEWKEQGIELIAPHRNNRRKKIQDGRKLRRYKRRWKIERSIA